MINNNTPSSKVTLYQFMQFFCCFLPVFFFTRQCFPFLTSQPDLKYSICIDETPCCLSPFWHLTIRNLIQSFNHLSDATITFVFATVITNIMVSGYFIYFVKRSNVPFGNLYSVFIILQLFVQWILWTHVFILSWCPATFRFLFFTN